MITASAPGFLIAGGLLAAIPILLHLLSRRPPDRVALPTARFLSEDSRTLLRLRRTPSDLPLLLLRVLFALALGAVFAGLRWVPERTGSREVILVDAGADSVVAWASLADAVREAASGTSSPGAGSAGGRGSEPPLVIAYGLDDGPRVVAANELHAVTRGSDPATLEEGLRALRREAAGSRFAEARVTWVGRPSWRIWSPAVGLMRPALWPGQVRLHAVEGDPPGSLVRDASSTAATAPRPLSAPQARISVSSDTGALARAVEALGGRVVEGADGGEEVPPDWIVAEMTPEGLAPWLPRIRAGAVLVAFGEPPTGSPEVPWSAAPSRSGPSPGPPAAALLVLDGDRTAGGAAPRAPGFPTPGARTLLTFDDGTPAAAAREVGEGCIAFMAASLTDPALTSSPAYPEVLRALLLGCRDTGFGDGPLDRGALDVLERSDLPASVEVAAILTSEGREFTKWLLLAALGLLGLEVLLTRSGGRSPTRSAGPKGANGEGAS